MATRLRRLQASLADTDSVGVFAIGGCIDLDAAQPIQLLVRCNSDPAAQPSAATPDAASTHAASSTATTTATAASLLQTVLCLQLPFAASQSAVERS